MIGNKAWQRHGCYKLGSQQYFNMPLNKAVLGCYDDWNSLDHFDPSTDSYRMISHFYYLRTVYGALQDGFNLVQRGNWTYRIERPGSNGTQTEMGLWSVSRAGIPNVQTLGGRFTDQVWMLYTNENVTRVHSYPCRNADWISSPFQAGVRVKNLFAPFEEYELEPSLSPFNNDGRAPYFGCLPSITMDAFGFKILVPVDQWVMNPPELTKFTPGHDHRLLYKDGDANATSVDIGFEFSQVMGCDAVTNSIKLTMASSGHGSAPTITNTKCERVTNADPATLPGGQAAAWRWTATLTNFQDGVLEIAMNNPGATGGNSTGVSAYSSLLLKSN